MEDPIGNIDRTIFSRWLYEALVKSEVLKGVGVDASYDDNRVDEYFHSLAKLLGYRVEKITAEQHETAA